MAPFWPQPYSCRASGLAATIGRYAGPVTDLLTVAEIVSLLEDRFPLETAESWDRVGLVCGRPEQPVTSVLFAVDPVPEVAEEAVASGAGLLVTHHPLLLRGVHSVAATSGKGRVVHDLIQGGCALMSIHTNADAAVGGVNDALADAVGLGPRRPLKPVPDPAMAKIVVNVLPDDAASVIRAMSQVGAGRIGDYDSCAYWVDGTGQFRALPGADPYVGNIGDLEEVSERRIEMVAPLSLVPAVVAAMRGAHPYEEPAFDVVELVGFPGDRGWGRIGPLDEVVSVRALAERLADVLPATHHGIRVAGDLDRVVRVAAVCGGAGDSLLATVRRSEAEAYVTSDLRHHPASEHLAEGGCALLDIAHWSGEWLWLQAAADALSAEARGLGAELRTTVSTRVTDPWSLRVGSRR